MLYGSSYIYIEFNSINSIPNLPKYITENISYDEIQIARFNFPKYIMLKFRNKGSNIDEAYNIMKINMKAKEWNVKIYYIILYSFHLQKRK
jgi:hypothetical protein